MVRWAVVVVAILGTSAGGCTKRNPDVCCSSAPECAEIGFDDITPCEDLRVCVNSMCLNPQCTTSAECSAPTPYCVGQICAAACTADPDCIGAAGGPFCAPDGTCVACLDSSACTDPAAGVCDDTTHSCRACTEDTECGSGICLAAQGVCAADDEVVYVSMAGADTGECTSTAPCLTFPYALSKITATRRVLRLVSLDYQSATAITIDRDVIVDANSTRLQRTTAGAVIVANNNATVTVEGIRLDIVVSDPGVDITGLSTVTMTDVEISSVANVHVSAGARLELRHSHVVDSALMCDTQGEVSVEQSNLENDAVVEVASCDLTIRRSQFHGALRPVITTTGSNPMTIENNLFVIDSNTEARFLQIEAFASPPQIRFNSFVNTVASTTGTDLFICSGAGTAVFTSNIVAGRDTSPLNTGTTCVVDHCVFDSDAGTIPGTGNRSEPFASMFVDAPNGDYHTASSSVAVGAADPSVTLGEDLAGAPRPQPAGTTADSGAFELPD